MKQERWEEVRLPNGSYDSLSVLTGDRREIHETNTNIRIALDRIYELRENLSELDPDAVYAKQWLEEALRQAKIRRAELPPDAVARWHKVPIDRNVRYFGHAKKSGEKL